MNREPTLQYREKVGSNAALGLLGGPSMRSEIILQLLDELSNIWLEVYGADDVGNDPAKIRILREARAAVSEGEPSERVKFLYREVFLRDDYWDEDKGGAA